jgi:hypothetical protein
LQVNPRNSSRENHSETLLFGISEHGCHIQELKGWEKSSLLTGLWASIKKFQESREK